MDLLEGYNTCTQCRKIFPSRRKYTKHMHLHQEKKFKCHICPKSFVWNSHLNQHLVMHQNKRDLKCNFCNFTANTKPNLKSHVISSHTKDYPYKCDLCSSGYITPKNLEIHRQTKHEGKHFICGVCKKMYKNREHYKIHVRLHDPQAEKRYKCQLCLKEFNFGNQLKSHVIKEHSEDGEQRTQMCDVCGKRLTSLDGLHKHMTRKHSEYKGFICDHCGKAFVDRTSLVTHVRIHTNEKPFECDECGKSFTQRSTLTIHKRLHSGERPYKCEICAKGYPSKSARANHRCRGPE